MKVFTATQQTQGQRPGDYHWCVEGELVTLPNLICEADANNPEGGCGCGRGWEGLNSHRATTTVMVRDLDGLTLDEYTEAIRSSLEAGGWSEVTRTEVLDLATDLAELASTYPAGTIVGHRLREVYAREPVEG